MSEQHYLWDLLESEAFVRVYIDREGFKAKKPAIIVLGGFWNTPVKKGDKYTVWFGQMAKWSFRNWNDVSEKICEILKTATIPITPRVEGRISRDVKKIRREINKLRS